MTRTTIYRFLTGLLVFLVPSNLFLKFSLETAYVNGLLVDYLIPRIYLSDLVIWVILGVWAVESCQTSKKITWKWSPSLQALVIIGLLLLTRQFFSSHPTAALWYSCKLIEMGLLAAFFWQKQDLFHGVFTKFSRFFTLVFQSGLAIFHAFSQKSLWGYLFLGEANLSHTIGLAKATFNGVERILPYGTTAHPNILGGVLALYTLWEISDRGWKKSSPIVSLALVALFLTQSVSAWLMFGIGLAVLSWPKFFQAHARKIALSIAAFIFIFPILFSFFPADQFSVSRRQYLNHAAWSMFIDNPLAGVGLNTFTARVEEYSPTREVVRFVQPVHHVGLLWLAETGLLGLLFLGILLKGIHQKQPLLLPTMAVLLPGLVLDHYFLTTQTGLLLLIMFSLHQRRLE